ncbi:MAG: hypothetical protein Q8W48_08795 [Candidatus Palauibacterales bacterium]|nr:hypothetical protein [Candidatus Palauibacterales bacterium]
MTGLDAPRLRWFWVVAAGLATTLSIFLACDSPGVTHEHYRGFWFDPTDFLESEGGRRP